MMSRADRMLGLILSTADTGRVFSVKFIKRTTGRERSMVARLGVSKGVKDVGMRYNPSEKGLLVVYEMPQGCYRAIPIENITSATVDGVTMSLR